MAYPSKTSRETILAAAVARVEEGGLQGLSLRALAASLEVAPNALYRYFSSRSALEAAIAREVSRLLKEEMERGLGNGDPRQTLRDIARAYLEFARRRPKLYDLILRPCDTSAGEDDSQEDLWEFVVKHVSALTGAARAAEAAVALWAFLHGMVQLEAVKNLEKPEVSFEFGLDAWLEKGGLPER